MLLNLTLPYTCFSDFFLRLRHPDRLRLSSTMTWHIPIYSSPTTSNTSLLKSVHRILDSFSAMNGGKSNGGYAGRANQGVFQEFHCRIQWSIPETSILGRIRPETPRRNQAFGGSKAGTTVQWILRETSDRVEIRFNCEIYNYPRWHCKLPIWHFAWKRRFW